MIFPGIVNLEIDCKIIFWVHYEIFKIENSRFQYNYDFRAFPPSITVKGKSRLKILNKTFSEFTFVISTKFKSWIIRNNERVFSPQKMNQHMLKPLRLNENVFLSPTSKTTVCDLTTLQSV